MAMPNPDRASVDKILRLVDQLTPEEHEQVLQEMKLQELRRELQLGIDQLDRGEGIPGEQVFAELRKSLQKKGNNK